MRYALLIYGEEAQRAQMTPEDLEAEMPKWFSYTADLEKSGKMLGGEALNPTSTAKTVRGAGGKLVTSDGPFAETKEQLGGFYLIDADSEEEALEWAGKMPNIPYGAVEVRSLMEFDAPE